MSGSNDICAQITDLIGDLSAMQSEISDESETAAENAARLIAVQQRRIFAQANFRRENEKHVYKGANEGLIKISKKKTGKARVKMLIGFDTETLRKYPELLIIEFGRPGKSPEHSSLTDKLGRKKGAFPENANVMPIRVGFQLAKEETLRQYAKEMFERTENLFRG